MSEQDVKPVASGTGVFAALQLTPAGRQASDSGKTAPDAGKTVPQAGKSRPNMDEIARQLNLASNSIGRDLNFEVDLKSGQSVIMVLDRETGEVIRQIPPEKARTYLSGNGAVQLKLFDDTV